MQNLFLFIVNVFFGKRWVLFDLRQGYKATLFMNDVETEMIRQRVAELVKAHESLQSEMNVLEQKDLSDEVIIAMLPEDQREDKKALYDMSKKVRGENAEAITVYKNRIASLGNDITAEEGELQKAYSITYKNRVKYEFLRNYKIK